MKNNIINGGFRHLISNNDVKNFLDNSIQDLNKNEDLKIYINTYKEYVNRIKEDILYMSNLEFLIIQTQNLELLKTKKEIRISVIGDYIYARHPFIFINSNDKTMLDIRTTVRKINKDDKVENLLKDENFLNEAYSKLSEVMLEYIEKTKLNLLQLTEENITDIKILK